MNRSQYLITFLLAASLFTACKKDNIEYSNDFQKSYRIWTNFKASSGNSYRYTVGSSSWTGLATETIITVESGKVTHRSFVLKTFNQNSSVPVIREQWDEDQTTLNTHANGATAITLDEIYKKAETEWLIKRKDAATYFETKNNGMISSCGYTPDNCADDCFTGIHISSIEKL